MLAASEDESFEAGDQGCSCRLCLQQGVEVIQPEPSLDGSCLVDKIGLCFPVMLLEPILHCDMRDEDVQ